MTFRSGNLVHGDGPTPAAIMLIGETPGRTEAAQGKPFIGPAGKELDRYLARVGLPRESIFITNAYRAWHGPNAEYEDYHARLHESYLLDELKQVQPPFIITAGRLATRWWLGDVDMDLVHGIAHEIDPNRLDEGHPLRTARQGWLQDSIVLPCFHPAGGLHEPEAQATIWRDFEAAAGVIYGRTSLRPLDAFPEPLYLDLGQHPTLSLANLRPIVAMGSPWPVGAWGRPVVAIDTEGSARHPLCLTFCVRPGEAFMIQTHDGDRLVQFAAWLDAIQPLILMHEALHDPEVLEAMGIHPWRYPVLDTMAAAYLLCTERQGLKTLGYRWAGMRMRDYKDVVGPYTEQKVYRYLDAIISREWETVPETPEFVHSIYDEIKGGWQPGRWKIRKPRNVATRAFKILSDFETHKKPVDLLARWLQVDRDLRAQVESVLGPCPEGQLSDVPFAEYLAYACADADATMRIAIPLLQEVERTGQMKVLADDLACYPMADRMQRNGFWANVDHFEALNRDLEAQAYENELTIKSLTTDLCPPEGIDLNINSSPSVARLVYDDLGFGARKITRTGQRSTSKKAIEELRDQHPIPDLIMGTREIHKGQDAFILPIIERAKKHPNVKINLLLTRTTSGRFAGKDPNFLAFPTRKELGKRIRQGFRPPPGFVFATWDLDQIEMRIMADESGDELLTDLFISGVDVHSFTASQMFDLPMNEVDRKKHRFPAKTTGYGILMGIEAKGLVDQFRMVGSPFTSDEQAQWLKDTWLEIFPRVRRYQNKIRAQASRDWKVATRDGRIRYLPAAGSPIDYVRLEALRQSHAHTIQGQAHHRVREWMAKLWDRLLEIVWPLGIRCEPVIQIHDELLFAIDRDCFEEIDGQVKAALAEVTPLASGIPILTNGVMGNTWGDLDK